MWDAKFDDDYIKHLNNTFGEIGRYALFGHKNLQDIENENNKKNANNDNNNQKNDQNNKKQNNNNENTTRSPPSSTQKPK